MVTHAGTFVAVRLASRTRQREASPVVLPGLARGERLLIVEADGHDGPVAATDRAIYRADRGGWSRLGWEQVRRVDWDGLRGALVLWGLTPAVPQRSQLVLRPASGLVTVARERVAWCTLPVPATRVDGVGTVLAVRRQPGADRLVWVVAFDAGVDPEDQDTSVRLAAALRRLRLDAGI